MFGQAFRVQIFGESHGECVGVLIDGCPPGLPLDVADFADDLARRRGGTQPGTTPRQETDVPALRSGVFNGRTTGAPLMIEFANGNVNSADYAQLRDTPRPGHADFVTQLKYRGFNDHRGGGHFSGRLTVALVAAGVVAKKVLQQLYPTIDISARLVEVGGSSNIDEAVKDALAEADSVGGIVECTVTGLSTGFGEPFFDSCESLLAHAAFAIPAVRGVEFGTGFAAARMRGSEHNDALIDASGTTATNHAGGINGGISNGNPLVYRIAIKPTSSIEQAQTTYSLSEQAMTDLKVTGRHDACIALRVPPVVEATTAFVVTDLALRHLALANAAF